eukprot:TRINITY_DN17180_c0_g1_i1.p1 TRINITY_DN17180_c0_g1~~TRINITY_DN17180_c0_g1_i1.p1  ORF type:complete len:61 (-),score=17.30 TRINITY_DN17180_c0_g1_i1:42-224(-)
MRQEKWRISEAGVPLAGCVVRERRYPFVGVEIDEVEEGSNAQAYKAFFLEIKLSPSIIWW